MKVYILNHNGVLDGLVEHYKHTGQLTENYHQADLFIFWQDVRGECLELSRIVNHSLKKPLLIMQHGRGATRDYLPPNNFKPLANKYLVWGESEKNRLLLAGVEDDKIAVVGCSLLQYLKPKTKRLGKNILFVPVISTKEEPENIMVYAELKKWESDKLIENLKSRYPDFKRTWAYQDNQLKRIKLPDGTTEDRIWSSEIKPTLPRNVTYSHLVNVKLTGTHDMHQYLSPLIISNQQDPDHIKNLAELLSNTDVMVCLEEGTMQLLACALDIPVIVVDIFKYGNYGGVGDYDRVEKIKTDACYWVKDLNKLSSVLDHALSNPSEKRKQRIAVCEMEGGAHLGDWNANAVSVVDRYLKTLVEA